MRFWTSDLHLGHVNIINFCDRPFRSVDGMNFALIERWNATVSPGDEVWVVGDFAMGVREDTVPLAKQLNGRKILIPGNHDYCWKGAGRTNWLHTWTPFYRDAGFEVWHHDPGEYIMTLLGDMPVAVCHFPRTTESRHDGKYEEWRPNWGGWIIHGHTHRKEKLNGTHLHVGVDAWGYRPVSDEQLMGLMAA